MEGINQYFYEKYYVIIFLFVSYWSFVNKNQHSIPTKKNLVKYKYIVA